MSDSDSIAQVAVVILLLILSVPALATAHEFSGTPLAYEDTATVDYNNTTSVSEAATVEGYSQTVTITVGSEELVAGTDYEWNATSGTVDWKDSGNAFGGETAQIEYRAYQRTQESAMAWTIIAPFMGLFGLFGFVAAIRALWGTTAEVWDL